MQATVNSHSQFPWKRIVYPLVGLGIFLSVLHLVVKPFLEYKEFVDTYNEGVLAYNQGQELVRESRVELALGNLDEAARLAHRASDKFGVSRRYFEDAAQKAKNDADKNLALESIGKALSSQRRALEAYQAILQRKESEKAFEIFMRILQTVIGLLAPGGVK